MKTKLFLTAGFVFGLLCAACSDSTNSVDTSNVTGSVNDDPTEDTTTTQNPNIETKNGATFETKGNEFNNSYDDAVFLDSYKSGAITDESYGRAYELEAVPTTAPGEFVEDVDYDVLPRDGGGDDYNGRTYGLLTASEWNDIDNWSSWTEILKGDFSNKTTYWKFYPTTLAAVKVVDKNGTGLANVSIKLLKGDNVEFSTKTDNSGLAYCWVNLFDGNNEKSINGKDYSLKINGKVSEETVKFTHIGDESLNINKIKSDAKQAEAKADIAFIVDATGSMGDEIRFLQSDLNYIIDHAHSDTKVALRTAVVFYRDESDEFLIQGKDFSTDVANTQAFIDEQEASGGGDYPEAVHSALEASLQNFSWNESARARIAFLILDAPAHHQDSIIESLQSSITLYAKNGIKLIPVAASGVDKDTESMLRFFEIITGGTYVFLTDDSGIGYSHIDASVGDHEVEKLADLMIRLIKKYVE